MNKSTNREQLKLIKIDVRELLPSHKQVGKILMEAGMGFESLSGETRYY